jgi:hypothetical protein
MNKYRYRVAILLCGAKTSEGTGNLLIDSGMPPFGGPMAWPHAYIGSMRNWL